MVRIGRFIYEHMDPVSQAVYGAYLHAVKVFQEEQKRNGTEYTDKTNKYIAAYRREIAVAEYRIVTRLVPRPFPPGAYIGGSVEQPVDVIMTAYVGKKSLGSVAFVPVKGSPPRAAGVWRV